VNLPPQWTAEDLVRRSEEQRARSEARLRETLDPNLGSEVKVELLSFLLPMAEDLGEGKTGPVTFRVGKPRVATLSRAFPTTFRPLAVVANVPGPGLLFYSRLLVGNVSLIWDCESGEEDEEDAWSYARGPLDAPTCGSVNRISVRVRWTDHVPMGWPLMADFPLRISVRGWSSLVPDRGPPPEEP